MPDRSEPPKENRFIFPADRDDPAAAERALKNFRYIVASVNQDAAKVWADLWEQLRTGVTPAGTVLPAMEQGFKPACGWAEFLEKFWLLKHYLDYIDHSCQGS
ncbi:MAG: hypothetical protein NTY19_37535 [Planctomycetota bacterium]|nr:hypothetical protein [Planctomycetota bacterium]